MNVINSETRPIGLHIFVGILIGVVFLHPVTMVIYLLAFQSEQTSFTTLLPVNRAIRNTSGH